MLFKIADDDDDANDGNEDGTGVYGNDDDDDGNDDATCNDDYDGQRRQ